MPHPHPSVRALLEAGGGDDPFVVIRGRARALVAEALALGWEGPPYDMNELASLRGLRVARTTGLSDDQDACVMPGQILLNARKHRVRQRYSVAHEVGHTLFPDYEVELRRLGRLWRREGDDSEFERLCQAAGAEFLLPLDPFRSRAESYGRDLQGALRLAEDFDASLEATVRRLVETSDVAMAALFLRPTDLATGDWLDPRTIDGHSPYAPLRVSLISTNAGCLGFESTRGSLAPRRGVADRAWKRVALARGSVVIERCGQESWAHAGVEGTWEAEAMTLPKAIATPHEVLCLMRRAATESPGSPGERLP